jgi:hypothetical protein
VVEREETGRLLADRAAIDECPGGGCRRRSAGRTRSSRLRLGIEIDPAWRNRGAAGSERSSTVPKSRSTRVRGDAIDGLADLDLDRDRGGEAPCGGVGDAR